MKTKLILVILALFSSFMGLTQDEIDSMQLHFVGGADIQKAVTEGSEIPANTGVGFLFDKIYRNDGKGKLFNDIETYGYLNIASNADTITAQYNAKNEITNLNEFGNYILIPSNSKLTATFSFVGYFYKDTSNLPKSKRAIRKGKIERSGFIQVTHNVINGFSCRVTGSNRTMYFPNSTVTLKSNISMQSPAFNSSVLLLRFGFFHEFIPDINRLQEDYSIRIGLDYQSRHIFGDIGQKDNNYTREQLFNTNQQHFFGLLPYVSFRFKQIVAEVSLSWLYNSNKSYIYFPGLTGTRMITSIKFVGGFPVKLKTDKKKK